MTKVCPKCKTKLSLENFYLFKTGKYSSYCKPCKIKYNNENDKKFPERVAETRRKVKLKAKYGINEEDFNKQFEHQEGKCAICSIPLDKIHVDHCHATEVLRGLLCPHCNQGLGHFRDNVTSLHNAIKYLQNLGCWHKTEKLTDTKGAV